MERTSGRGAWPDPEGVERLLAGAPADPRAPGDIRLAALLRLLAGRGGPARALDPGREEAAVAAFRAARAPRPGGARSARALAGVLVAAFTLGGLAVVAAGVGVLPGPFPGGAVHTGPPPAGADRELGPPVPRSAGLFACLGAPGPRWWCDPGPDRSGRDPGGDPGHGERAGSSHHDPDRPRNDDPTHDRDGNRR